MAGLEIEPPSLDDAHACHGELLVDARTSDVAALPNRDFVLRYRVAGPAPSASVLLGEPDARGEGHYLMVVHPPATDVDAEVGRREVIFVVDRSWSSSPSTPWARSA